MLVGYRIDQDMFNTIPGQVHIVAYSWHTSWQGLDHDAIVWDFGLWRLADQG